MDESLSEWLAFREPADWAARSAQLLDRVTQALASREAVNVLDLCTGTGSNIRYLLDRLPNRQHWLVVDRDATAAEAGLLVEHDAVAPAPAGAVAARADLPDRRARAGQRTEVRVAARPEGLASATEAIVAADFPRAVVHDHRSRAVVEVATREVAERVVDVEAIAA